MGDIQNAISRIWRVQRFLNGPSAREAVLDGLSETVAAISLPPPRQHLAVGLDAVLTTRKSHYRFHGALPGAEHVSSLLRWALGPQRTVRLPDGTRHRLRMAPAAGGLTSLAVYIAVRPGGDIPPGVFRYDADGHHLDRLWSGDPAAALRSVLVQPEFAERAPVAVFLAARLDTTLVKYPIRHYRTLHIDSGIALQNLYLVATALDLAACAVTAFDDHAVTQLLRLPDSMFPTVVFPFGLRPA